MIKRVFLIVLDSFGIGGAPDEARFEPVCGTDTLGSIAASPRFCAPVMGSLGLFNIDGVNAGQPAARPRGAFGRLCERSMGKDTTIGHWEISGIVSPTPLPTYPDGFPEHIIDAFSRACGRGVLCNKPYSGTKVIYDYGREHMETGKLIVYTSGDSVFQIAAHENTVPPEKLYEYCRAARAILRGGDAVGRVIARPFVGSWPNFVRTKKRHDFSLEPPRMTMLDILSARGLDTISVGKISDIFAGRGISVSYPIASNADGMEKTSAIADGDFRGLCFVNLVDFDMKYGHRRDIDGYAGAISEFDGWLGSFITKMRPDDLLMITADHGCDPSAPGTDHTREAVPLLVCGGTVSPANLGTRLGFCDIGKTICGIFGADNDLDGDSFAPLIINRKEGNAR